MADIVCCSAFLSIAVVTSITQSWPRQELSIGNKRKQCCSQGGDMSRRRRKLTSSSCFFSLFFIARYFVSSFPRLHVKWSNTSLGLWFPTQLSFMSRC
jgi:hypothetical protein